MSEIAIYFETQRSKTKRKNVSRISREQVVSCIRQSTYDVLYWFIIDIMKDVLFFSCVNDETEAGVFFHKKKL